MNTDRLKKFAAAAANAAVNLTRPDYFASDKGKGENYELKRDLNSEIKLVRKEAVKKVIAHMTVGKDVSDLFPHVLKNISTDDLELKKLVYLYLMNYAKSKPELAILAINTFCRDTEHASPLVRALAIRTMGCIEVAQVLDYLVEPLSRCLKDENPYVRRTAVLGVAKVWDLHRELAHDHGYPEMMHEMLADSNPSVLANVVSCLGEMDPDWQFDPPVALRLLNALSEANEWGQMILMDAVARGLVLDGEPADMLEGLADRVLPRLQHGSAGVVLSAFNLLLKLLDYADEELAQTIRRKLIPPVVTLLTPSSPCPAELQWTLLRSLRLTIAQPAHAHLLQQAVRILFCRYHDPPFLKREKLHLLTMVVEQAPEVILNELIEYAREVDQSHARAAIAAMAECCLRVPSLTESCVRVFSELIEAELLPQAGAAAIALRLLQQRHPGISIPTTCLDTLTRLWPLLETTEAQAAVIALVSTHNQSWLMQLNCLDLEPLLQSELLTAIPDAVSTVLSQHPSVRRDIRDRAQLLCDHHAVKVKLCTVPQPLQLDPLLVETLRHSLGTIAACCLVPPDQVTTQARRSIGLDDDEYCEGSVEEGQRLELETATVATKPVKTSKPMKLTPTNVSKDPFADLLAFDTPGAQRSVPLSPPVSTPKNNNANPTSLLDLLE